MPPTSNFGFVMFFIVFGPFSIGVGEGPGGSGNPFFIPRNRFFIIKSSCEKVNKSSFYTIEKQSQIDVLSIQYKTRLSLGVPEIIFNAAEPIPDFFQELSTKLPQPARVSKIRVFTRSKRRHKSIFSRSSIRLVRLWEFLGSFLLPRNQSPIFSKS